MTNLIRQSGPKLWVGFGSVILAISKCRVGGFALVGLDVSCGRVVFRAGFVSGNGPAPIISRGGWAFQNIYN
jgi:hypothetical protein